VTEKAESLRSKWTGRIVSKYILLQIPGTVLLILIVIAIDRTIGIPTWLLWSIVIGAVLKDIILFPFVWRSYDSRTTHPMIGSRGVTVEPLSPEGYVRIRGELWQAKLVEGHGTVKEGEAVCVTEAEGIRLTVEPE